MPCCRLRREGNGGSAAHGRDEGHKHGGNTYTSLETGYHNKHYGRRPAFTDALWRACHSPSTTRRFNDLTYDTHIGHMLRDDLYAKLKRRARFNIIPPEAVDDNITVYKLQDKQAKTSEDYETIAKRLGADTIIELYVLSYGITDPGVLSKPHTILMAKVVMTRAKGKEILWQTKLGQAIPQEKKFGFDYEMYEEEDAKLLKEELDTLSSMLAEQIIEAMGFEAQLPTAKLFKTSTTLNTPEKKETPTTHPK